MFNMFRYFYSISILVTFIYAAYDNSNIICTSDFCSSIRCPNIPQACKIQNATHNGIFLKSPTICNCCKYCLQNLALDESCASGSPGGSSPSVICGDVLTCNQDDLCGPMSTTCTNAQVDFDKRKLKDEVGHLEVRPQCDRQGKYQPFVCIPGEICFCVNENGNRIFGEISFRGQPTYISKCGCSRDNDKAKQILNLKDLNVLKRSRCLPDGNYDTLQCIDKQCICVDKENASPWDTAKPPVYVGRISQLSCFNKDIHIEGSYLRSCEQEYSNILNITETAKEEGFDPIGMPFPNCQLDGRYAAIQENRTHKYCTDPDNNILENFIVEKIDSLAKSMNCYCARSRSIVEGFEKPSCLVNGNYNAMQCRRGKCRCVDINGVQTKKEVDKIDANSLKCTYE